MAFLGKLCIKLHFTLYQNTVTVQTVW